jgi:hypothetical protein
MGFVDADWLNQLTRSWPDLLEHPQLIPYRGSLGGTTDFIPSRVFVLNDRWVYAEFEDGHIGGGGLFQYTVKDGRLSWSVVRAFLY